MTNIYLSPSWFYMYSIIFEAFFAVAAVLLTWLSFKVYKVIGEKNALYFSCAFIFIAASYIVQTISNIFIFSKLNESICRFVKISSIAVFDAVGSYIHIFLMIVGLSFLFFITLKTSKLRTLLALIALPVAAFVLSRNYLATYYLISSIYLAFVSWYYIGNYLEKKDVKVLLVSIAFFLLFLGNAHYFIIVNHQVFYVISHFLELAAYIMILANFYLVFKR